MKTTHAIKRLAKKRRTERYLMKMTKLEAEMTKIGARLFIKGDWNV